MGLRKRPFQRKVGGGFNWALIIQSNNEEARFKCQQNGAPFLNTRLRPPKGVIFFGLKMLPQGMKKAVADNPKKVANLIDLVNLPSTLREFMGQSQSSQLNCFRHVWSYIKLNNLQDPINKNIVNCDQKLKNILSGKSKVELTELPMLIRLHFPKQPK